jgi:hypothetical protein
MTGLLLMVAVVALVRLAPDLPLSLLLNDWLARRPAEWLLKRSRREVIAWAIVAGLVMFGGEYVLVLGGPHAALVLAADLAAYIDAMVAVATLASLMKGRAVAHRFAVRRPRLTARRRARSAKQRAVGKPSSNDDDRPLVRAA